MWPFSRTHHPLVVLFDITASRVAGAYVSYPEKGLPEVVYTEALAVKRHASEEIEAAVLRTLKKVGEMLITRGAPAVQRVLGHARAGEVIVSMGAPWQETRVHTEVIQSEEPFMLTSKLISQTIADAESKDSSRTPSGTELIGMTLNGYAVQEGVGRKVKTAALTLLSSTLDTKTTERVYSCVRSIFHSRDITFTAFAPVTFEVLKTLYPHERSYLILNVGARESDLAFVRHGVLVDIGSKPHGLDALLSSVHTAEHEALLEEGPTSVPTDQSEYIRADRNARFASHTQQARREWLTGLGTLFKQLSERHPLPRTVFLLTEPSAREYLRKALDSTEIHTIWLSDEPLNIIALGPEHMTGHIRTCGEAHADVYLEVLALYQSQLAQKKR